jgi:hypothetical protein
MTFAQWDALPRGEQWLRAVEWLEVREAEQEASEERHEQQMNAIAAAELQRGFDKGLGG